MKKYLGPRHRKFKEEAPANAGAGYDPQLPSQEPGQPAGERQAKSGSLSLLDGLGLIHIEDPLGIRRGDPGPLVFYSKGGVAAIYRQEYPDRAPRRGVPDSVAEQVDQDLLHPVRIGATDRRRL